MRLHKIFGLLLLTLLVACNDDKEPVYDLRANPELEPLVKPAFVLNEASKDFIAETFSWTKGSYGFDAAPTYNLEIDNNKDFTDPVGLGESNRPYVSVTVEKLNMAAIVLGGVPGKASDLYIRIQASLTPREIVYSQPIDILVTPYAVDIDFPKLYVPGSYQGWDIANAPILTSMRLNNKFEGYLNMVVADNPAAAVLFKITTKPVWGQGVEYGAGDGPGSIKEKGGDISLSPQGYYLMLVDLNAHTYNAIPVTQVTLSGTATGTVDKALAFDPVENSWSATMPMAVGSFFFKTNNEWSMAFGDSNGDFVIDKGSNKGIQITDAGTYRVKLWLKTAPYVYELEKQ